MDDLISLIWVEGDVLQTFCRMYVVTLACVFALGVFNIIKSSVKTCN